MNDRTNEVCRFDRNFYLEFSRDFETGKWEDGYFERKEFSDDIEAMALELAYTRYLLAKAENVISEQAILRVRLQKDVEQISCAKRRERSS
jgi:hypothetical protein